ncbi:MAG TPA: peptidase M64 N-terminal domain-containing protein, partial [Candidatus Desulfaltia sp.]|nr:peptidase M64 N-terminal domain-containing protein [Candidatus Desulfaltia sp.]
MMMKRISFFLVVLSIPTLLIGGQSVPFDRYFIDRTMRIDYFHVGNAREEAVTLDRVYEQGTWAGSRR